MLRQHWIAVSLIMVVLFAGSARAKVTDEEIQRAINKLKQYFYKNMNAQGTWEHLYSYRAGHEIPNKGGATALVTLALLYAGETPQNPALAPTMKYLRTEPMPGCYSRSFRVHIWAHLPDEYLPNLKADVDWLMNVSNTDLTFPHPVVGELENNIDAATGKRKAPVYYDNSITQYGHLAIWEALKRDVQLPYLVFQQMSDYWLRAQGADGGWGYKDNAAGLEDAYGSMTAAGVTCLIIAQQGLHRTMHTPDPKITKAIDKGIQWLDRKFDGIRCVGNNSDRRNYDIYYTVCLERAALAGGTSTLNGKDWFRECAAQIVEKVMKSPDGNVNGSMQVADSAFALMFLARGRVPVWANKIQVPDLKWNQHPNDMFFLTNHISHRRESEVNWQIVPLDKDPDDWLQAPLSYLSLPEELKLTDRQKKNLKKYMDQGGMLVCNPHEKSGPAFANSVKKLAAEFYPEHQWRTLPKQHPLFTALHRIEQPERLNIAGVSNGARELILMLGSDVGYQWQADAKQKGPNWELAMNLFSVATNKGELRNRLVPAFEPRSNRKSEGDVTVGRAKYVGNWRPEALSWERLGHSFFNRTGLSIRTQDVDLADLGSSKLKLIHLAGTDPIKLSAEQIGAIKQYTENGGTILIETVGGLGQFSLAVEDQLSQALGKTAGPLGRSYNIISGEGLANGYNCSQIDWRWRTAQVMKPGPSPRLSGMLVNGSPGILFSHEDLTTGVMGIRQWQLMGYSHESSVRLMTNVVLSANKGK